MEDTAPVHVIASQGFQAYIAKTVNLDSLDLDVYRARVAQRMAYASMESWALGIAIAPHLAGKEIHARVVKVSTGVTNAKRVPNVKTAASAWTH